MFLSPRTRPRSPFRDTPRQWAREGRFTTGPVDQAGLGRHTLRPPEDTTREHRGSAGAEPQRNLRTTDRRLTKESGAHPHEACASGVRIGGELHTKLVPVAYAVGEGCQPPTSPIGLMPHLVMAPPEETGAWKTGGKAARTAAGTIAATPAIARSGPTAILLRTDIKRSDSFRTRGGTALPPPRAWGEAQPACSGIRSGHVQTTTPERGEGAKLLREGGHGGDPLRMSASRDADPQKEAPTDNFINGTSEGVGVTG